MKISFCDILVLFNHSDKVTSYLDMFLDIFY